MKSHHRFFLALLFSLLLPLPVNAAVLGTIDVSESGGGRVGEPPPTTHPFIFDIGGAVYNQEFGGTVFDMFLGPSDAGNAYVVSSGTEFEEAVSFLTNGVNDVISWQFDGAGTGWTEGGAFYGDYTGAHGTDLAGSQIDNITLYVNGLSFTPQQPGRLDYDFDATVTINGTPPIPEPESYAMMLAGLAGLSLVSRKRRKSVRS